MGDRCRYTHVSAPAAPAPVAPAPDSSEAVDKDTSKQKGKSAAKAKAAPPRTRMIATPARTAEHEVEWILDTGAGNDLCPSTQPGQRFQGPPVMLETANGLVPTTERSTVALNSLNENADCLVLKSTVHALSLGRRCAEHGYQFHWEPWANEPTLIRPDGVRVPIKVENYVPVIVNTDRDTMTQDHRHVHCMPAPASSMEILSATASGEPRVSSVQRWLGPPFASTGTFAHNTNISIPGAPAAVDVQRGEANLIAKSPQDSRAEGGQASGGIHSQDAPSTIEHGDAASPEADGPGSASNRGVPASGNDNVESRTGVPSVDIGDSPVDAVTSHGGGAPGLYPFTVGSRSQEVGEGGVPVSWSPGVSSIAGLADGPSSPAGADSLVRDICRDMTGGKTQYDDKIDTEDDAQVPIIVLVDPEVKPEPEFDGRLFSTKRMHGAVHLSTHLPKAPGCDGCGLAKAVKSQSRRKN